MDKILKFSNEVCDAIKYYVYRLVDPNNGQTFYVGKGKGNRVFAHVKCTRNYNGKSYFGEDEDDISLKFEKIRKIYASGQEVIHIIHRWNLDDEKTALEVEAALIDAYGLDILTNRIKGHWSDNGSINAELLEKNLSKEVFKEPSGIKYMIIKVKDYWVSQRGSLYDTVRSAWKINKQKAELYPYVLGVVNGIVEDVYQVEEWHKADNRSGRYEFTGSEAPKEIRELFLQKKIPERFRKKGQANPILYSDR